jgi:hypothetical protein
MMKQKTHLVLWLAMLVAAVAIVLNPWPRAERTVLGIILLLGVVVGIVSFVKTFSGPITEEKLDSMFRFCYTVALLVVLLSVVFFFFPREKGNQQWPEFTGPVGIVLGCSEPPSFANDEKWIPDEISCDKDTTQWLLNFGGKVTTCDELTVTSELCEGTRVRGGMVVPLYFLIVSLIGALISLTRRVPEYQRRIGPNCLLPISREEAREYMIFQLMQVMSAPLIASAAYYLISPMSRASSISVAFIAGFSSETILLWIRSIVIKLQPEKAETTPLVISPPELEFGAQTRNATSETKTLLLANRGQVPLKVSALTVRGDFAWSHGHDSAVSGTTTLPFTLAAGGVHELNVTFTPTGTGLREGDITITDNGVGGPRIIHVAGTGVAADAGTDLDVAAAASPIQISRTEIAFGAMPSVPSVHLNRCD